eukprot:1159162-Pelagomonas_calceolata.AAC.6
MFTSSGDRRLNQRFGLRRRPKPVLSNQKILWTGKNCLRNFNASTQSQAPAQPAFPRHHRPCSPDVPISMQWDGQCSLKASNSTSAVAQAGASRPHTRS